MLDAREFTLDSLSEIFAAARKRIADGMEIPRLFRAQDWTPGPGYGRERPQTFGERRAAYQSVIDKIRRGRTFDAIRRRRAAIIEETPACRELIAAIRALENLPLHVRLAERAAPLEARLETIIAGRMAEEDVAAGRHITE